MLMQCRSLRILPTATLTLHIKHTFIFNADEEILILQFFIKTLPRCSWFILTTIALRSHFIFLPQKPLSNVKTFYLTWKPHDSYTNICTEAYRRNERQDRPNRTAGRAAFAKWRKLCCTSVRTAVLLDDLTRDSDTRIISVEVRTCTLFELCRLADCTGSGV
jgi:hypothetical protein